MPYRRTPKVQERLDAQRETIIAAATRQLAEHGYGGCSVAAVAERARVAVGSVYRHFPTKADLVVHVFRQVVTREVEAVRTASAEAGAPAERVLAAVDTFAQRALKAPKQAYALLAEPVDALIDAERLEFRRAYTEVIAEHVAAGVRDGVLPPQDGRLTAAALVGAAAEVLIGPLTSGNAGDVAELRTFILRALGGSDARHA
ncbi:MULTISPECIES: TetR/AcrR family transcriptional regulator [unclassified Amycolatopsis]|uniref:TetR/AcrR family transcriptional regulator n=1 Tax=unclassified Amycolatopsis TaxID=2618356 RepID=UPI002875293A|nr:MULTISPECIES: TetR/AcrR family transcriptional regulator [unclassified Amycolatopsis]MDS0139382.1 TetR/AcrR family transcriptional regulator [Amycolatopsis sp. 505]MDS0149533.1 TetR/AcrR family transcriptional regulator [Amycolatopsis sp. CM201R]